MDERTSRRQKTRFAINWKIPGTLFNIAADLYPGGAAELQRVEWHLIFNSYDLGVWSHGGRVYPQSF